MVGVADGIHAARTSETIENGVSLIGGGQHQAFEKIVGDLVIPALVFLAATVLVTSDLVDLPPVVGNDSRASLGNLSLDTMVRGVTIRLRIGFGIEVGSLAIDVGQPHDGAMSGSELGLTVSLVGGINPRDPLMESVALGLDDG